MFLAESAFYSVVPPMLPSLVAQTHMTTAEAGILVAAYPAGVMVAALPAISLVSRQGVRVTTLIGLGLLTVATLAFAWSSAAAALDVARLIQGVGGAIAWAGALSWLISEAPASRRGRAIGGAVGAALVGMVVGPIVGAGASWAGRGIVFSAIAVVLVAMAVGTPATTHAASRQESPVRALTQLMRLPRAAIGNGLVAVIGVINGTLASLMPLLITSRLGSAATIAGVFVSSYLLASFWNVALGRVADRVGRVAPVAAGFALAAVILPFLPSLVSLVSLGMATVIAGSVASGLWTPTAAIVADEAGATAASQAVAVAATNACWAGGGTVGALVVSKLAGSVGFSIPFLLVGVLCAMAAVLCLAFVPARRPGPRVP